MCSRHPALSPVSLFCPLALASQLYPFAHVNVLLVSVLGLLNTHVCPKYWPVAETASFKLSQEIWGSPREWTVCLPPDLRHLVMVCLSNHLSWKLLGAGVLTSILPECPVWLPVQGWAHRRCSVGGMRMSEDPLFLSIGMLASPLFSQCTQRDSYHKDPVLVVPTRSGDTDLFDHLSAWVQFQKHQEEPLDAPKPCPPAG